MKDIYTVLIERERQFRKGKPLKYYADNGIIQDPYIPKNSDNKPVAYPQEFAFLNPYIYLYTQNLNHELFI
ncbi:MAG: hypothetical protein ACOZBL_00535 [Patescibacteria group bacterium]